MINKLDVPYGSKLLARIIQLFMKFCNNQNDEDILAMMFLHCNQTPVSFFQENFLICRFSPHFLLSKHNVNKKSGK